MRTEHSHIHQLIDKLENLPPERIQEIEDFIDFIRQRDQDRQLTHAAMKIAEPGLNEIWNNPDDAIYDTL